MSVAYVYGKQKKEKKKKRSVKICSRYRVLLGREKEKKKKTKEKKYMYRPTGSDGGYTQRWATLVRNYRNTILLPPRKVWTKSRIGVGYSLSLEHSRIGRREN